MNRRENLLASNGFLLFRKENFPSLLLLSSFSKFPVCFCLLSGISNILRDYRHARSQSYARARELRSIFSGYSTMIFTVNSMTTLMDNVERARACMWMCVRFFAARTYTRVLNSRVYGRRQRQQSGPEGSS